jgi:hypothetical protein
VPVTIPPPNAERLYFPPGIAGLFIALPQQKTARRDESLFPKSKANIELIGRSRGERTNKNVADDFKNSFPIVLREQIERQLACPEWLLPYITAHGSIDSRPCSAGVISLACGGVSKNPPCDVCHQTMRAGLFLNAAREDHQHKGFS